MSERSGPGQATFAHVAELLEFAVFGNSWYIPNNYDYTLERTSGKL